MAKQLLFVFFLFFIAFRINGQICSYPGQYPVSAILICGTDPINVTTPTYCGQTTIPLPCNDGFNYRDLNPNFFRMACYSSGTLGFSITPDNAAADYSWQLFDITGTNPVDIYTNPNLFVSCNWSTDPGETGASVDGTSLVVCSGSQPLFSKMPDILQGHTYMLMISNQSASASGYQLTIAGGSAVIADPSEPKLLLARASCDGRQIIVRLNKKMQCNTIAGDGSDFSLNTGAVITAAIPGTCTDFFGSDTVYLSLDRPLINGNYILSTKDGTDGNTMVDICGVSIPAGNTLSFNFATLQPSGVKNIAMTGCAPPWIELEFSRPVRCASIAADGSDFSFSGPQPVSAILAQKTLTACQNNDAVSIVRLDISTTWVNSGTYQVNLKNGNDGNTVLDECGLSTPAGSLISFDIKDPVSARFTYSIPPSCNERTVSFFHDGNGGAVSWNWNFDNRTSSVDQNTVHTFTTAGTHIVQLIVTNGKCTDTLKKDILIPAALAAAFEAPAIVCPGDTLHIINKSSGNIEQWLWEFGNGTGSSLKEPAAYYYNAIGRENYYTIRLIAKNNSLNCADTATRVVKALAHCSINVPSAFTPNGDGKNDYLYPLNALKADKLEFKVYNRTGQLVFSTNNWTRKWDGSINGIMQETGIYVWFLSFVNHDTGERVFLKGTTLLMR